MKPNLLRTLCGSTVVLVMVAVAIQAQDFTRSYPMGAGASVSVRTVSGNVKVTGYAGEAIVVVGHKEGRVPSSENGRDASEQDPYRRARFPEPTRGTSWTFPAAGASASR